MKKRICLGIVLIMILNIIAQFSTNGVFAEPIVYGDANGDGAVNTTDITVVMQNVAGWTSISIDETAADVDCNGVVNTTDITVIMQYVAGWSIVLGPTEVPVPDYETHESRETIKTLLELGYIETDASGNVNPDENIKNHELVSLMNNISMNYGAAPTAFNDVDKTSPHYETFAKAKAAEIVEGDALGNVYPENNVTATDIETMINKARGSNENVFSGTSYLTKAEAYEMLVGLKDDITVRSDEGCITVQDTDNWHSDWSRPEHNYGTLSDFSAADITVTPSIRSFSVKIDYYRENVDFRVYYKVQAEGDSTWKRAYDPTFVPSEKAYYTSASLSTIGRGYQILVYPYVDGLEYTPVSVKWTQHVRGTESEFFYTPSSVQINPTFENAGYYVTYADPEFDGSDVDFETKAVCTAYYREKGTSEYKSATLNQYDGPHSQFRGSITGLKEGCEYEFRAVITKEGQTVKTVETTFKTKTSDVPIAKTIQLKDIVKNRKGSLVLDHLSGTPDGYIKIVDDGTTVINGGEQTGASYGKHSREAVMISDCHYLVLEGFTVTGGGLNGVDVCNYSSNVHIVNFDVSHWGRKTTLAANVDGYQAAPVSETGSRVNADTGIIIYDVTDILVERCYIHDPRGKANAWYGPKNGAENGVAWTSSHPQGPMGMHVRGKGGIVIRYCDIIGSDDHRYNDCLEGIDNGYLFGSLARDADFYGNMLSCAQDDAVEFDGGGMNVRVYGNRMEQTYTNISTAPTMAGPIYIFRNLVYNGGDEYFAHAGHMKQGGGTTYSHGRNFVINNTFEEKATGIRGVGYGSDENRSRHLISAYNNISVVNKGTNPIYAPTQNKASDNVYDYNLIGVRDSNGNYKTATASVNGTTYVMPNGKYGLPKYRSFASADFRLASNDTLAKDTGAVIPNFAESFVGSAPDIGAFEWGNDNYFLPTRPVGITADKYFVYNNGTVTLIVGDVEECDYKIEIVDAIKWLTVTPCEGTLTPNAHNTFTITVDKSKMTRGEEQTVMLIRLKNGYSIPITVKAKNPDLPVIVSGH